MKAIMHVLMYASTQVCKTTSMQVWYVCKHAIMQVCNFVTQAKDKLKES